MEKPKVKGIAFFINGSIQILPLSFNFDIHFIDSSEKPNRLTIPTKFFQTQAHFFGSHSSSESESESESLSSSEPLSSSPPRTEANFPLRSK